MKKSIVFWVSYSDLMTSMFFIMLVFSVTIIAYLQYQNRIIGARLEEMRSIDEALGSLDSTYFSFDKENKRYKLNIDPQFDPNSADINTISKNVREQLVNAGKAMYNKVEGWTKENPDVYYLLIIEGNTQRFYNNYIVSPDGGYKLSYLRSLSLYNFWKDNGIDFRELSPGCETIIAGSGYFSLSRVQNTSNRGYADPDINRRFTIQITAKWKDSSQAKGKKNDN